MSDRHPPSRPRDPRRRYDPALGDLREPGSGGQPAAHGNQTAAPRKPPPFRGGDAQRARPRRPQHRRGGLWTAVGIVVALIIAGGWAWSHQTTLRSWLPQTQLNSLLTRANKAFAANDLTGGPGSARALYSAAQTLDPGNERAARGLQKVGRAELAKANSALHNQDFSTARAALEQARSLLGGGAKVDAVDHAISKAVLHNANVDVLINQARAALANGRIQGAGGAAALFGKVLAGDPRNAVARHGMNQIGNLLATQVRQQLDNHDRAGARKTLQSLAGLLPSYAQLPDLRAAVAAADRKAATRRDQALVQGEADLRAGKLTGKGEDNALAQFKAALAADPGSAKAEAGLGKVAAALITKANTALDSGHRQAAKTLLGQAAALAPQSADLAAARSRLMATRVASAATSAPPTSASGATQSAKVARLVQRAAAAARKGEIMLPPGDSAYDLYRTALGIDDNSAKAQAGLRALPGITREQFRQALAAGNLQHAQDMLATMQQLDPGDPSVSSMRHRLGSAWLDRAGHEARLGHTSAARSALKEARRLVPQDPRIGEVSARIDHSE